MIIDSIAALSNHPTQTPSRARRHGARVRLALAAAGAAGALMLGMQLLQPADTETPLTPVAVSELTDADRAAVHGEVAEIFGNKFILTDPTGRALVETGPAGEHGTLITRDETLTVEGRFEHGFFHASRLIHADGRVDELHPPHHHGPRHHPGKHGPEGPACPAPGPRPDTLALAREPHRD